MTNSTIPRRRVLVTTSRMPFTLDLIRKLGKQGHEVHASDTFRTAPGSHSTYLAGRHLTASPRYATQAFLDDVADILDEHRIELLLPSFEEVFYIARNLERLRRDVEVFASPFDVLLRLHDKDRMRRLASELGIRVPETIVAESDGDLQAATRHFGSYFARPVFSRGGVQLLTNAGPLAGAIAMGDCHPTPAQPWLVQPFVRGLDVCTCSIAHRGRIAAHGTYVHPREIEHAGGIVFESIEEPGTLEISQRIVEAVGYHGHVSFDFLKTDDGLVLIECNPRPTAGLFAMSPQMYEQALFAPPKAQVLVAEPGIRKKYSVALIRDLVMHWREAPEDIKHLLSEAQEIYAEPGDLLPGLYQLLSYSHVIAYRMHVGEHRSQALMEAYFDDVLFNGPPPALPRGAKLASTVS